MKQENGFTLLEVLIALAIFAFFSSVYVTRETYNLSLSSHIKEEAKLQSLCEQVMNEMLATPQELTETLLSEPQEKKFEKDKTYGYKIEWKKLKLPDLNQFVQSDDQETDETSSSGIERSLMNQVKTNMESLIWQLRVTVRNTETDYSYSLSTWIYNEKTEVKFGGI